MNKKLSPTQITQWTKNAALEGRGDLPLLKKSNNQNK